MDGAVSVTGGKVSVTTSGAGGEGIESKATLDISGGEVCVNAYDDAINSASTMTVSGGLVYARATNNDGLDANGNCFIKGGLVYAVSASSPEVGMDANVIPPAPLHPAVADVPAADGEAAVPLGPPTHGMHSPWATPSLLLRHLPRGVAPWWSPGLLRLPSNPASHLPERLSLTAWDTTPLPPPAARPSPSPPIPPATPAPEGGDRGV